MTIESRLSRSASRLPIAVILVIACLAIPLTVNASAPAKFKGAANPIAAVKAVLPASGPCFQNTYHVSTRCPITWNLSHRLGVINTYLHKKYRAGFADYLCRCQASSPRVTLTVVSHSGNQAIVNTVAPAGFTGHLTFLTVHWHVGWLISDAWCTGHMQTSLYRILNPGPCT